MCVLDEGGAIVKGVIPGLNKPVGMIGSSEKGYVNIELTAKAEGGHSSTPQRETAIGILCNAVAKLEKHPFPTKFKGPAKDMFSFVTAEMGFKYRFLFSNLWLFNGLIKRFMLSSPVTAASIRTTSVATIINGGFKANVLPDTAKAIINVRILPGDNFEGIVKHMEKIISDRRISVKQIGNKSDKLSISSTDSLCFKTIQKTIKQVFPEALASPYQVLGATDSRYYSDVSADIFRFGPLNIHVSDLKMNHGVNERISIDNFIKTVEFYILFITNIQDSLSRGNV
jgi:Acetylornithine deacetylase/Succinyl-diaminopimelate desuccinylase and related deacylases